MREDVQHGAEHPRVHERDDLLILEEPLALARGLLKAPLEVLGEPRADFVHSRDASRDRFARGFGGEEPLGVTFGAGAGGGTGAFGRDLGLRDVDVGGADLRFEVLDAAGDLWVVGARVRLERSLERGDGVVVITVGLEGHAAAEIGLLPVGTELDAHVSIGQCLLDLWGWGEGKMRVGREALFFFV